MGSSAASRASPVATFSIANSQRIGKGSFKTWSRVGGGTHSPLASWIEGRVERAGGGLAGQQPRDPRRDDKPNPRHQHHGSHQEHGRYHVHAEITPDRQQADAEQRE